LRENPIRTILALCLFSFLLMLNGKIVEAQKGLEILPTHSGYINDQGFFYVVGEVENVGDVPAGDIRVNATFYNAEGEEIAIASGSVKLETLLPARKAPFTLTLYSGNLSRQVYSYKLSIASFSMVESKPVGLEIVSNSSSYGYPVFRVSGIIKNIGDKGTTFVRVIATFYDESGKVVDALLNYSTPSTLHPGETAPFEIVVNGTNSARIHHYILEAESYDYLLIPEFNLTILSIIILSTFTFSILAGHRQKAYKKHTKNKR